MLLHELPRRWGLALKSLGRALRFIRALLEFSAALEVNLIFLLGHVGLVVSPFWALACGEIGVYMLVAIESIFLLMGAYAILAAMRMAWILRGRRQISSCAQGSGLSSEDCEACKASCKASWQHLVCVPIYKESDEMVLATITRLNLSAAAPRMRVVFAMEEATDRTQERFELYKRCLSNVPEVCFYVHPAGASKGEIRGLCSNLAYALSQDVAALLQRGNGGLETISKYVPGFSFRKT